MCVVERQPGRGSEKYTTKKAVVPGSDYEKYKDMDAISVTKKTKLTFNAN